MGQSIKLVAYAYLLDSLVGTGPPSLSQEKKVEEKQKGPES